jgi:hypothetical protein
VRRTTTQLCSSRLDAPLVGEGKLLLESLHGIPRVIHLGPHLTSLPHLRTSCLPCQAMSRIVSTT